MQSNHIMVIVIVLIVMIASVFRAKYGSDRRRLREESGGKEDAETARLRDEVKVLKERLQVLERITVEKENSLEREIENLRDR
jgi:uncharacterized protein YlxW (UPF0749 family)